MCKHKPTKEIPGGRAMNTCIKDQRFVFSTFIPLVDIGDETSLPSLRFTCSTSVTDTDAEMTHGTFSSKRGIAGPHDQRACKNTTEALKERHSSNKVARSCFLKRSPSRRQLVNLGEDAILSTQDRIFRRANPSSLSAAIFEEGGKL